MPKRCIAGGCTSVEGRVPGVSFFRFPLCKTPSQRRRKQLWVNFVKTKRKYFCSTSHNLSHARICSKHFKSVDFLYGYGHVGVKKDLLRKLLKKSAVPCLHSHPESDPSTSSPTSAANTSLDNPGRRTTSVRRQQSRVIFLAC